MICHNCCDLFFIIRAIEQGDRGRQPPPPPPPFSEANFFFLVKSENITFSHVNDMWDFTLFVEQDISGKK